MKLYRYEAVGRDSVPRLNELLVRGWQPVREVPTGGDEATGQTLVLLQKDSDFPTYPGESVGGVSVDFIREVPLFAGFSMDELRGVLTQSEVLSFQAGDVVFNEGDIAESIYVVLVGEVELLMPELPVNDTQIALLKSGEIFGESTFFAPAPHSITARCGGEEVMLLALGRVAYDELHQAGHPAAMKLAYNAARSLAARLQSTDRWMWDLLRDDQNARIAASWRRFRSRIHSEVESGGRFFGV